MSDRDYVLGTHDEEIERLGLQHRVWRPRMLDAWRRAGFTEGQRILDFGAGPGHASLDLAEIVGPGGEVIAMERSARFLAALRARAAARGLSWITPSEVDLAADALPVQGADGAWCRWIFAFLRNPRAALEKLAQAVRPGGAVVIHEYLDYRAWRMAPRAPAIERFVEAVMQSWRDAGGEPDIALDLPCWLEQLGFTIEAANPLIDVATADNYLWRWPAAFFEVNLTRLVETGAVGAEEAKAMRAAFTSASAAPGARMVTPLVLEIIARR